MQLFTTNRLCIRHFLMSDSDACYDLMSNPNVMSAIPLGISTREESDTKLQHWIATNYTIGQRSFWAAVALQDSNELIGMCAFLKNDEDQHAIAYRFREDFWGKGYGSEVAKGLIDFGFSQLQMELITGDAWIKNESSMRILGKFMTFVKEFPNPKDQLIDRRFQISKAEWLEKNNGN